MSQENLTVILNDSNHQWSMTMINKSYHHDIAAVLVTYNPNTDALSATIQAVLNQVSNSQFKTLLK